jgi:RNA polymerase sigma factor (sigma-70 family)
VNTQSDSQLLCAYAEGRSEAAFAELVRRYIDLVHSAAFRMVNDPHLAQDVTQGVFVALAKDAGKLTDHPVLSGWLHRTTRNIAAQTVRTEVRRRNREKEAAAMNEFPDTDAPWEEIAPHLDAAIAELSEPDRDAVLLRYFENKPAQEMAAILGISAEAAQKRVSRAVERLRENFAKRGITTCAAGLSGIISANAVQTAPAGFGVVVSSAALVTTASSVTRVLAIIMTKEALVAAVVTLIAGALIYQKTFLSPPSAAGLPSSPTISMERKVRESGSLVERMARTREPVDRKKELERLKQEWLETHKSNEPEDVAHRTMLAEESARLLLCSEEMIQLLDFLDHNKRSDVLMQISAEVEKLFDSPLAAEARKLLVALPESVTITRDRAFKSSGREAYRDLWSKAAGKTCPDDEFEAFRAALNCASCAKEALYGRNLTLMRVDPEAAFISSLEAHQSGVPSLSGSEGLRELFMMEGRLSVDYEKLERLLPAAEPLGDVRYPLFRKWAEVDPVAAAKYLLDSRDRLDPSLAGAIVHGCSFRNRSEIIALVSRFPEGTYYDHAAVHASMTYTQGGREIFELIRKIQDPELRAEALKHAEERRTDPDNR